MSDRTIAFAGRDFKVADKLGVLPLMRFAKFAKLGVDSDDMEGLIAMYDLLAQVIADEDWAAFQDHASATHADSEEILAVVTGAIEVMSARPTQQSSGSPDGLPSESVKSLDTSSSGVIARLEDSGRPDLALIVTQAVDSRRSA